MVVGESLKHQRSKVNKIAGNLRSEMKVLADMEIAVLTENNLTESFAYQFNSVEIPKLDLRLATVGLDLTHPDILDRYNQYKSILESKE